MRLLTLVLPAAMLLCGEAALAYVPAKAPTGVDRHWLSGSISVQLAGPTTVDGHGVHDAARAAIASWNAVAHATVDFSAASAVDASEPIIGNGENEIGWVERSDSPYFIPGVPCTVVVIYNTMSGSMSEADATCNAMAFQWPSNMFGLYTQEGVADAQSEVMIALGFWLGLDSSLEYEDPMFPHEGSGLVRRQLTSDEFAFVRYRYGDGTSTNGSIQGTVRFSTGAPVPYADVVAWSTSTSNTYGAVADATGAYTIYQPVAGSYYVIARPLTTDPYIVTSLPYRSNSVANLDFAPEYYAAGAPVDVTPGSATQLVDIVVHRAGTQPDSYEINDIPAAATPLSVGYSKIGGMHMPSDGDWYWFETSPSSCYLAKTSFHGASIVATSPRVGFWSKTRLSLYEGGNLIAQNGSKDDRELDPGSWVTYCETGSGRRLDLLVEQRESVGGPGYFYKVSVQGIPSGSTLVPEIDALYPNSGWANRNRFVWIDGAGFMPGSHVDLKLPGGTWVASTEVIAAGCDNVGRCSALKALLPPATPGLVDVRVTSPNGLAATKANAFTYLSTGSGPMVDRTPELFGTRDGHGKSVCVGDYDGDGDDDIFKSRYASLPYQLFRNDGATGFTDVAATSGLDLDPPLYGQSCSFIDVDDDGDLDLYTTNLAAWLPDGSSNELYLNQLSETGEATFFRSTPPGLGGQATRYQRDAAWADFDRDGRIDVILAYDAYAENPPYHDAVRYFTQGANGSFSDQSGSAGFAGYIAALETVRAADFDGDGCEDVVFFTRGGSANRLYRGNCHGHFDNVTSQSHVADGSPWCAGVGLADFNGDGRTDIFCGTFNAGPYPARPRLWINAGDGTFVDRATEGGLYSVARNMDVVLPLDVDNDGLTDVYLGASENGWPDDRKDVLLRNVGGNPPAFVDITDASGMYPTTHDGTGWCVAGVNEYNCDRDAFAGAVLDWRQDGAQDVFLTGDDPDGSQRGADFFWDNRENIIADGTPSPARDWIDVALKGANTRGSRVLSNRLGLGAQVTVIPRFNLSGNAVPTETQCLQYPLPAGVASSANQVLAGNQSQSSTVLHFGLGVSLPFGRKVVDCIKVRWPSGLERAYTGLTANTRVQLAEDVGRMKVIGVAPNSGLNTRSDPTTVTGLHFDRDVVAVPEVFFGAAPAAVTFVSEHELTVRPPLGQPPGTVNVTVVNTDGAQDTLLAGYTFIGSNTTARFKDPVPELLTPTGQILTDPGAIAATGTERSGVIADGVTQLVFEMEVTASGSVRFELDDDDDPANPAPPGESVGTLTPLGGGSAQTKVTVPAVVIPSTHRIAHAIYRSPQSFVRNASDQAVGRRTIRVRTTFIDASGIEYPSPARSLELYRVPVLYVHGMWGDASAFAWSVIDDTRWISRRADYSESNSVSFAENAGTPPRLLAELKKDINDRGIAGTRFFVFAHSMGAVLFKLYIAGAGAPYARADNYFAGDVYALVSVDAPYFGAHLASFVRHVGSLPVIGPFFSARMRAAGQPIDDGCMKSLDPGSSDVLGIPSALGAFHAITGWGGGEMRRANVELVDSKPLVFLRLLLEMFNMSFDNYLLKCSTGDDLCVCTESQEGGLSGGHIDAFHYVDGSSRAIHYDSITREHAPSLAAERLLNTPTHDTSVWALVLPETPQPVPAAVPASGAGPKTRPITAATGADGFSLAADKSGDSVRLIFTDGATKLLKSSHPDLSSAQCVAVAGTSYVDLHELTHSANVFYAVGGATMCGAAGDVSIDEVTPMSGSTMGGYTLTISGEGFGASPIVRIGDLYASDVVASSDSTLTCRAMPGNAGRTTIAVTNQTGHTATTTFVYLDPVAVPGGVTISAPLEGAIVAAGSTISVSAAAHGGFAIAKALATSGLSASAADNDPGPGFATELAFDTNVIGPTTIELLAKDSTGNIKSAAPVQVTLVVPGNVSLLRLETEPVALLYATPVRQLRVFGIYSDGIRRDVTHAPGILFEIAAQDIRKPNYPFNGTGVAIVDPTGRVTAKTCGTTYCHVTLGGRAIDVVVEVAEIRPKLSLQRPGFVSWPYQGPGIVYDLVRGKLSALRATGGNYADPSAQITCVKNDFTGVTAADPQNPSVGDGFFYLMRESRTRSFEDSPFWQTSSQSGLRTIELNGAVGACP